MSRTKEYRRFMQSTKLEKRIKIFYFNLKWWQDDNGKSYAEYRESVLKGQQDSWLRNTGVPCSCYSCSGCYKFVRSTQSEICKLIKDQLQ